MVRRGTILMVVSAGMMAGGVGVLIAAIALPLEHPLVDTPASISRPTARPAALPPLKEFEPLFALDLRRPLIDAPKPDPAADALTTDSPLPIRLSGTIIEPGHNTAVFSTGLDKTVLRHVGEEVSGAEVIAIDPDSATLRYQGQLRQIKLEKAPIAPAPLSSTPTTPSG